MKMMKNKSIKTLHRFLLLLPATTTTTSKLSFHSSKCHLHHPQEEKEEWVSEEAYAALQKKIEGSDLVFPSRTEVLREILQTVLGPEEAEFLSVFPNGMVDKSEVKDLRQYRKMKMTKDEIEEMVEEMLRKGMMTHLDIAEGLTFVQFPILAVGWFEHLWMRYGVAAKGQQPILKDSEFAIPKENLGEMFHQLFVNYFDDFVANPETHQLRTVCREEAIFDNVVEPVEIMDYDSVVTMIHQADRLAVQPCCCRNLYNSLHPDNPSKYHLETCMSLNIGADFMISGGVGREIDLEEALELMEYYREGGFVHNAQNSQDPQFVCNCMKNECYLLNAYHVYGSDDFVSPSIFIADFDQESCENCLQCVKYCPVDCYSYDRKTKSIDFDDSRCLGCGVCADKCTGGAIAMIGRENPNYVPIHTIDMIIRDSYRRKKMHLLAFPNPHGNRLHKIMRPIFRIFENTSLGKWVLGRKLDSLSEKTFNDIKKKKEAAVKKGKEKRGE